MYHVETHPPGLRATEVTLVLSTPIKTSLTLSSRMLLALDLMLGVQAPRRGLKVHITQGIHCGWQWRIHISAPFNMQLTAESLERPLRCVENPVCCFSIVDMDTLSVQRYITEQRLQPAAGAPADGLPVRRQLRTVRLSNEGV